MSSLLNWKAEHLAILVMMERSMHACSSGYVNSLDWNVWNRALELSTGVEYWSVHLNFIHEES